LTTTATVGQTVTEMLLVLFTLIFFLHGSGGIWQFLVRATPSTVRGRVDAAGAAAWPCWSLTFAPPRRWPWSGRRRRYWDRSGRPWCPLAVPLGALVFLSAVIPVLGSVSLLLELSIGDWTAVWEAQQRSGRPAVLMPCRAGRAG
jgi:hypothetical protein